MIKMGKCCMITLKIDWHEPAITALFNRETHENREKSEKPHTTSLLLFRFAK